MAHRTSSGDSIPVLDTDSMTKDPELLDQRSPTNSDDSSMDRAKPCYGLSAIVLLLHTSILSELIRESLWLGIGRLGGKAREAPAGDLCSSSYLRQVKYDLAAPTLPLRNI